MRKKGRPMLTARHPSSLQHTQLDLSGWKPAFDFRSRGSWSRPRSWSNSLPASLPAVASQYFAYVDSLSRGVCSTSLPPPSAWTCVGVPLAVSVPCVSQLIALSSRVVVFRVVVSAYFHDLKKDRKIANKLTRSQNVAIASHRAPVNQATLST